MAKLREGVKEERKAKIHEAAIQLFSKQGFTKTTMEQVAENAGFAVGTLYNYYPSKGDLLLNISKSMSSLLDEEISQVLYNQKETPQEWICDLLFLYMKNTMIFPKELWREFFGYTLLHEISFLNFVRKMDTPFLNYISLLIAQLIHRKKLNPHINTETVVEVIYDLLQHSILRYISGEIATENDWKNEIKIRISMLVKGIQ